MFGHEVRTYNMERTICDCLRSRNHMDLSIVTDAMKRYARNPGKDLNTLMQVADVFGVTKILRRYLEVLL